MKKSFALASIVFIFLCQVQAQTTLTEKSLTGLWQLKFQLTEEDFDKALDEEDNILAKVFMKGISGVVKGVLEEIDVKFEFMPNNRVVVMTTALGEIQDDEYTTWEITKEGYLIIGNTKSYKSDTDTKWKLHDGVLIPTNSDEKKVVIVKID